MRILRGGPGDHKSPTLPSNSPPNPLLGTGEGGAGGPDFPGCN